LGLLDFLEALCFLVVEVLLGGLAVIGLTLTVFSVFLASGCSFIAGGFLVATGCFVAFVLVMLVLALKGPFCCYLGDHFAGIYSICF
jgi:hypothetical protein